MPRYLFCACHVCECAQTKKQSAAFSLTRWLRCSECSGKLKQAPKCGTEGHAESSSAHWNAVTCSTRGKISKSKFVDKKQAHTYLRRKILQPDGFFLMFTPRFVLKYLVANQYQTYLSWECYRSWPLVSTAWNGHPSTEARSSVSPTIRLQKKGTAADLQGL